MKKINSKVIITICHIVILIVLLIAFISTIEMNSIIKYLLIIVKKVENHIDTLVLSISIISLIITIKKDRKEKEKTISINIQTQYQIEFEKELNTKLKIYDEILNDISRFTFTFTKSDDYYIDYNNISTCTDIPIKYNYRMLNMTKDIIYYYKNKDKENNALKELTTKIEKLNIELAKRLKEFFELSKLANDINSEYRIKSFDNITSISNKVKKLLNKKTDIVIGITTLINKELPILHDLALKTIEEREKTIKDLH